MKPVLFALLLWIAVLAFANGQTVTNSHGVVIHTNTPLGAWLAGLSDQAATNNPPRIGPGLSTAEAATARLRTEPPRPARAAHAQKLPCKTPKELEAAIQAALQAQDTNAFWQLHCWTNVSTRDEAMHKHAAFNGNFQQLPGDRFAYSSFRIEGVEPGFNTPRPVRARRARNLPTTSGSGTNTDEPAEIVGVDQYNIPVTGVITFKSEGSSPSQFEGREPVRFSSDNGLYFGKGPDGNFWLAVEIFVPKGKSEPSR